MKDFSEQIKTIAQDLINLEVNTIIKPNMTGRKMPKPRQALIEIAKKYNLELIKVGFPLDHEDIRMGSFESFELIRAKAHEGIELFKKKAVKKKLSDGEDAELVLLSRIKTMSDQIRVIFKSLRIRKVKAWDNDYTREDIEDQQPPLPLTPEEIVMIRKIWEMGLEEIAMQTIIQLDGDVLTRIQSKYAKEENAKIHHLHNQSVSTALAFWGGLIGIVKDLIKAIG